MSQPTTSGKSEAEKTPRARAKAPVFVLGCVRSGTTLLYHMLLSAGGFAVYRSESHAINLLEPRFGDLSVLTNKKKLMAAWLDSKLFKISGLDAEKIEQKVLAECRNGGDFLRIVMEEIARNQGVERWAECTPEHLLFLPRIKQTIPDALIIHVIRDGRDVALSLEKQKWIRPLPMYRGSTRLAGALYWEWMVRKGREDGRGLGADYCEVRFEDLIQDPRRVLAQLSRFIDQDLDYDRIREVAIGSVAEPNTSFQAGGGERVFNPVGRWRELPRQDVLVLEGVIGGALQDLGYPLAFGEDAARQASHFKVMRATQLNYFALRLWLKANTPLGRYFVTKNLSWL
ncbi:MAG: sulfotransferase [Acidobacteriia bacterium]|nr:sulfotransferase [Terriglobia bacterium]